MWNVIKVIKVIMWDVINVIMGLEMLLPYIIFDVLLIGWVTVIVSKLVKTKGLILNGVLSGGALSILLLILIWTIVLIFKPDEGPIVIGILVLLFIGQPLSWIAASLQLSTQYGNGAVLLVLSGSLLLDWCMIGAFVGWFIQRRRARKKKKESITVGEIPHHNI
jgi:hypothetical protein